MFCAGLLAVLVLLLLLYSSSPQKKAKCCVALFVFSSKAAAETRAQGEQLVKKWKRYRNKKGRKGERTDDPQLLEKGRTGMIILLEEWPAEDELKQFTAVSLLHSRIPKFPEEFECPNVQSFLLYNQDQSLKIPDGFFNRMKKLKLLDLTEVDLSPVPPSIQFLENLQTLCLDFCTFEDISAIGELKKLKVLSLIGSLIDQLPTEVGKLTRLQLLDLSKCQRLEVIPAGVLSCLTQLEDLYMKNSFVKWENDGQRSNASLGELKRLSKLVTLEFHIIDTQKLPEDLFSVKLERFIILIGDEWDWSSEYETSRTLKLKLNISIELERVKVLLMRSENLYLEDLKGVKNVLCELDGQGFPQL